MKSAIRFKPDFVGALAEKFNVILASASPRRRELLSRLDIDFQVHPSEFAEDLDKAQFAAASDYVVETAARKARDVYRRVKSKSVKPLFVIGSDTVVVNSYGTILEKPKSDADAAATLKGLSGRTNMVYTGVCLIVDVPDSSEPQLIKTVESTEVVFDELDDAVVDAYVKTGEPHDKAGSYAYQSFAGFFVREIRGDYYNVVGFPCARFFRMLQDLHQQGII
ncbi:hypothetical protein IWW36_005402 [Coemansia brasiliensis]|uniref:Maf-like protein n=1 Tax=Coemansia brasiliensis TaxID=2650707 RepID=A0A9W8LY57_9FUNG|nr:hypothetical protein IWW36_005402 [Coemansia brasiliensis]